MGMFASKDEKEQKKLEKLEKQMERYGLENLSTDDKQKIKLILMGLMGNSLIEAGTIFSGKAEDSAKLGYLGALVDQNWLLLKKLDEISKKLDK